MDTLTKKQYFRPDKVEDAWELSQSHPDACYVAGGTDYWVNNFQGNKSNSIIIDLSEIKALRGIRMQEGNLYIGSQTRLHELSVSPAINAQHPALVKAIKSIATPVIRKSATLGGNLLCENRCTFYNQSEFWRTSVGFCLKCEGDICIATGGKKACYSKIVSDTAAVLISCHASIAFYTREGIQKMPLKELYSGNGLKPVNLPEHAIITGVFIPTSPAFITDFNKLRLRESMDFSSLSTAVTLFESDRLHIVLTSVDPGPVCVEGNWSDRDELLAQAVKKARIVDNDVFSRTYRKEMIYVFLHRSFTRLENK